MSFRAVTRGPDLEGGLLIGFGVMDTSTKSKRPTCAACGKGLTKFVSRDSFTIPKDPMLHPCITDPSSWRKAQHPPEMTGDGQPPTRGRLGDNVVCGVVCGYKLAMRLLAGVPDVMRLLPPGHDPAVFADEASVKRREKSRRHRQIRKDRALLEAGRKKVVQPDEEDY